MELVEVSGARRGSYELIDEEGDGEVLHLRETPQLRACAGSGPCRPARRSSRPSTARSRRPTTSPSGASTAPARICAGAFDDVFWEDDMSRESAAAAPLMRSYRSSVERYGQAVSLLEGVRQDDPLGLPAARRSTSPTPPGAAASSIASSAQEDDQLTLGYLAFGQRHPSASSSKWAVYELAFARLHGRTPRPRNPGRN